MKLTVGQLTAQHIGMHIRVGEHADGTGWRQDGQLWAVTHKEEATWVSLDLGQQPKPSAVKSAPTAASSIPARPASSRPGSPP